MQAEIPTRPYLIRALHEWCGDNGYTPYIVVRVDDSVRVPREYVKDGEIVLNVSADATSGLRLGNDAIEFKARFGGVARDISVPVGRVVAIYARENGQGMAFPPETAPGSDGSALSSAPVAVPPAQRPDDGGSQGPPDAPPQPPAGGAAGRRPALKRIK
jgi:stringent starvation protein B